MQYKGILIIDNIEIKMDAVVNWRKEDNGLESWTGIAYFRDKKDYSIIVNEFIKNNSKFRSNIGTIVFDNIDLNSNYEDFLRFSSCSKFLGFNKK